MLTILENRTYRHLFLAQVTALIGTGLLTVALGLLAFELAGENAGAVLGTALAIKMIAYVGVAPIASAFTERISRRAMLVALDLVRAAVALFLPFVTEIWQIYVLIFVLQSASAGFTPTFQATIPDILPDEKEYTRALSLSRLAYDLESLISPMLAAALLAFMTFHNLFVGTVVGFLISAALVLTVTLPTPKPSQPRGIYDRMTRGIRIYLATPRLRGLLAINLAVASMRRFGDREHGRVCAGCLRPRPAGDSPSARGVWRRIDGRSPGAAATVGADTGPERHSCRSRHPCHGHIAGWGIAGIWLAVAALVRTWSRLLDSPDAVRTTASAFR